MTVPAAPPGQGGPAAAAPRHRPRLDGYLVVDKPAGWTSFDVVARARRLLGERKIGHAGTLDPMATGVLPLAVGTATKTLEYLADATKTYVAEITFGVSTDTLDADGRVVAVQDASDLREADVGAALAAMCGPHLQVPPLHAAIKVGGRRLYDLARRGEAVAPAPRPVVFHALDLLAWAPPVATVLVDCSKGTYVRALARDLGAALGPGAHLSRLVRTRTGPFRLDAAITLDELAALPLPWAWPAIAVHPDAPVLAWPAVLLGPEDARRWRQGATIAAAGAAGECRAYDAAGDWLGVGRATGDGSGWRPVKVAEGAA